MKCFVCDSVSLVEEACQRCLGYMATGIILISIADGEETSQQPRRTGKQVIVSESGLRAAVSSEAYLSACSKRVAYVPDAAWQALGLGEVPGQGPSGQDPGFWQPAARGGDLGPGENT